jgi:hypothetical protein
MPMEGQATRLVTPLTRRDRQAIAVFAVGCVIAVVAIVVLGHPFRAAPSNADCVIVSGPSSTGYTSSRTCGPAARGVCLAMGRLNPAVTAQCRRLALPIPPA